MRLPFVCRKYLRKHDWGLNADIRCFPLWASPSPYTEPESKFIQGRMLVSQLGFLSPQQRAHFHQIDQSPAFFRALKNLDRTPEYAHAEARTTFAHAPCSLWLTSCAVQTRVHKRGRIVSR
jgi:hypothetical protein